MLSRDVFYTKPLCINCGPLYTTENGIFMQITVLLYFMNVLNGLHRILGAS